MSMQCELESRLNSFDAADRRSALGELAKTLNEERNESANVNMHFHSFNSYNAEGWSPSRIAWESAKAGLYAIGLVDFDVLDGLEEFKEAGEILGLRTNVSLETRTFYTDYADKVIDSPGEPGVSYVCGTGFVGLPEEGSARKETLDALLRNSGERNLALLKRINDAIPQIAVDYKADVLPMTPSGNATERHIISAYIDKAAGKFSGDELVGFWAEVMKATPEAVKALLENRPSLEDKVRSALAKRGGVGYVQPSEDTFPRIDDFFAWVISCGAIPMESWLDGTNEGEADGRAIMECSRGKGAAALNIIPDRNWNISDADTKALKVNNLREIVAVAEDLGFPINIGTEMNKGGQPFVDDLAGPVLSEFADVFQRGARILVGHGVLARYADFSYSGEKAASEFSSVQDKNCFFEAVGALPAVTVSTADALREAGAEKAYAILADSASATNWTI